MDRASGDVRARRPDSRHGAGCAGRAQTCQFALGVATLDGLIPQIVGAQMLDAQNNPVPTQVVRGGGMLSNLPGPQTVDLAPGGTADFTLSWGELPVGNETTCPPATQLAVIPPDEVAPLIVALTLAPCNAGTIHVSAVRPSS